MVHTPGWWKEWRQRRQARSLHKKLHRRLEHSGGVRQLILNNVRLHEGAIQSISDSIQDSYRGDCYSGSQLKTLTVKDCFLKDNDTIRVLINLMQSQIGNLERVALVNNTLDASRPLNTTQLNKFVDALGVVQHITIGPEFMSLESTKALYALCFRAVTLHLVNFPFGFENDEQEDGLPRQVPPSIRLCGLYKGIKSKECRVQTLILQGSLVDDSRFALLVDAMQEVQASTPASAKSSNLTVKHLKLMGHCLHSRSCDIFIRLMGANLGLESIEIAYCAFLSSIKDGQAQEMGAILARDTCLTDFALREVHLTDTLAIPLFHALQFNNTLLHLTITTRFLNSRLERFPPVSTTGYRALVEVLPGLTRLQTLHLGRDFYFSSRMVSSSNLTFVADTTDAINRNGSILNYEGGEVSSGTVANHVRYGHYHEIIPPCMERNRASLVATSMLLVAYDVNFSAAAWHAAILHMAAKPERQSALFQILHRVLTDPQVPLRSQKGP